MPIYAYRCSSCGHAQDVLQRISDPVLTVCPACGAQTYAKQVTAAGFQLKGSGWYVTDFRGGNTAAKPAAEGGAGAEPAAKGADSGADNKAAQGTDSAGAKAGDGGAKSGEGGAKPAPAAAPPAAAPPAPSSSS